MCDALHHVLVLADDLTGAAEIAGIARRHGLPTRLARGSIQHAAPGVNVIDTDSRLLSAAEAAAAVVRAAEPLRRQRFDLIYKKTDSVLRGPVVAEVEALAAVFNRPAVLLVPQNPSRGRTIVGGEYLIDGLPLHTTPFANDPDHPARTSIVSKLVGTPARGAARCADPPAAVSSAGLTIGAADCDSHMAHWAAQAVLPAVLPAGGADFFEAILRQFGLAARREFPLTLAGGRRLFVCGSASAYSATLAARARDEGIPLCPMPDDLTDIKAWRDSIALALRASGRALVNIQRPLDRSPGASERLQNALANVVADVLSRESVDHVFMEGGATASAVCRAMGWRAFEVADELAPGVVCMRVQAAAGQHVVVKPGSYAWPDAVW